jgi:signal transduction histidine kinase
VTFEDDGDGLEISDTLSSEDAERLGLTTMRERVKMLGGDIHFNSEPGRGTRVTFDLPIS